MSERGNLSSENTYYQEFVVCYGRTSFFVRINGDVWDLEGCASIVSPVPIPPVRLDGLFDVPFERFVPVFSACFDLLEIRVWISLNVLLSIRSRHLGC
jgi:hypothetical protein